VPFDALMTAIAGDWGVALPIMRSTCPAIAAVAGAPVWRDCCRAVGEHDLFTLFIVSEIAVPASGWIYATLGN
jgi:hypothetical protein